MKEIKTAFAMDGHKFAESDSENNDAKAAKILKLGCLSFPDLPALEGESDGDVAAHALADAILIASGSGDLGSVVGVGKNSENKGIGASGETIIEMALAEASKKGFQFESGSVQIVCERPKVSPVAKKMSEKLSLVAGGTVSVGATTLDGLGAVAPENGDRAGIIALASVVLHKVN